MSKKRTMRDLLVYVGISLSVITLMIAYFAAGFGWQSFVKWFGLSAVTLVLSSIVWTESEAASRKSPYFLKVNIGMLIVHCLAWVALLITVQEWKFIWFSPMLAEIALFLPARRALIERLSQSSGHNLI